MSGFSRAASRLTSGAICWLTACSVMASGWDMVYPEHLKTYDLTDEIFGAGESPGPDEEFIFEVREHGLQAVIATTGTQTTEDESWTAELGPPNEATWPVGSANAVLRTPDGSEFIHITIGFALNP